MRIILWLRDYSDVWMFVVFLIALGLAFWPRRAGRFERDAHIPLQDDR
jgi:cbb3-type cytochrome oxidase subunit 3